MAFCLRPRSPQPHPRVPVEEYLRLHAASAKPVPTVIRGVLFLPLASSVEHGASSTLLDISGREVMELRSGANDVHALAPGVYFVREGLGIRGEGLGKTRKVVVTR